MGGDGSSSIGRTDTIPYPLGPLNGSRGFNLSDLDGSNTILPVRVTYLKVGNWMGSYKVIENSYEIATSPQGDWETLQNSLALEGPLAVA